MSAALVPMLLALAAAQPAGDAATPGPSGGVSGAPVTAPATAANTLPAPPVTPAPRPRQQTDLERHAVMGDMAGGQVITPQVLAILADRRIDPDVAYILWQLSRRPIEDWTLGELAFVSQIAPTEVEAGVPVGEMQILYQFWGLDPNNIFNPTLAQNWQSQSTAYNPSSATQVGAISSAECQTDPTQMTLGTFRSCIGASQ